MVDQEKQALPVAAACQRSLQQLCLESWLLHISSHNHTGYSHTDLDHFHNMELVKLASTYREIKLLICHLQYQQIMTFKNS